jgi:hypothetical protein
VDGQKKRAGGGWTFGAAGKRETEREYCDSREVLTISMLGLDPHDRADKLSKCNRSGRQWHETNKSFD